MAKQSNWRCQVKNEAKLKRVIAIQRELDIRKELYAELDKLTLELRQSGFTCTNYDDQVIELVDNFAEGNTVFRPAGVKRFELQVMSREKWFKKRAKARGE